MPALEHAARSSLWRERLLLNAETQLPGDLTQTRLPHSAHVPPGVVAIAHHPLSTNCCVASCGGTTDDSTRISHVKLHVGSQDRRPSSPAEGGSHQGQARRHHHRKTDEQRVPLPLCCLAWGGSSTPVLVGGSRCGQAALWACPPDAAPEALRAEPAVCQVPKMKPTQSVPPLQWAYNSCITSVSVAPDGGSFAGTENGMLHVWDCSQPSAKPSKIQATDGVLLCSEWSPHSDSIVAVGSGTGSAKLVDLRDPRTPAWQFPPDPEELKNEPDLVQSLALHAVRALAMSPLVEHWLATAHDGGEVRIYDVRTSGAVGPVLCMPAAGALTLGIAWSPLHAELLCTAGADSSLRLSSLRHGPAGHTLGTMQADRGAGPAVGAVFARQQTRGGGWQSAMGTATHSGEVLSATIADALLEKVTPARGGRAAAECEKLAYCRAFAQAEEAACRACDAALQEGRVSDAMQHIDALTAYEFKAVDRERATRSTVLATFAADLEGCSARLPHLIAREVGLSGELARRRSNLEHTDTIQRGGAEQVVREAERIAGALSDITPGVYEQIVTALSRHAWHVGVDFFLRTEAQLGKVQGWKAETGVRMARRLLGPLRQDCALGDLVRELRLLREVSLPPADVASPDDAADPAARLPAAQHVLRLVEHRQEGRGRGSVAAALKVCSCATLRLYAHALVAAKDYAGLVWLQDAFNTEHTSGGTSSRERLHGSDLAKWMKGYREQEFDGAGTGFLTMRVSRHTGPTAGTVAGGRGELDLEQNRKFLELCVTLGRTTWRLVYMCRKERAPNGAGRERSESLRRLQGWLADLSNSLADRRLAMHAAGLGPDLQGAAKELGEYIAELPLPRDRSQPTSDNFQSAEADAKQAAEQLLHSLRRAAE
eukprot:TRINITY_DN3612_c0_g6_i1.p1 TRINITY_DN3612_c0_g6~~TRINITY_DN3612_c0_g6_i1.p1  ORF type:complete len:909 (+),score=256.01 TRINITY_DN3612_c0_g6_i1:74-2728(+)